MALSAPAPGGGPAAVLRAAPLVVLGALGLVALAGLMTVAMYATTPLAGVAFAIATACGLLVARRPVAGVWCGLLAIPLEILNVRFGRATITLAEVVLLLTALVGLVHLTVGPRFRIHPVHLAFGALLVIAVAGVVVARDTEVLLRIVRVWLAYLIVSVLVARATRHEAETTLFCLVVAGGIIGAVALLDTGSQQLQSGGDVVAGRAQTGFAQPNVLGFFLVLALSPAVVLSLAGPRWRKALSAVCAVAILGGLLLSLSRASIIGAAFSLLILLRWKAFRRAGAVLLATLGIVVAANLPALSRAPEVQVVTARIGSIERADETNPRVAIYRQTPLIIADNALLGVGEGNFALVSPSYGLRDSGGGPYDHAHNVLLTLAAETGLLGFGAAIVFILAIWRTSAATRRRAGPERPLQLAVSAALTGVLVAGFFDYPLRTNVILAVVLIHVGVLAGIAHRSASTHPPQR